MSGLQLNLDQNKLARFSGLYAAYVAVAVLGRTLDDGFVQIGLMPAGAWEDPVLFGAITMTVISFIWTIFSSATLMTLLARRGFQASSALSFFRTVELIMIETTRAIAATIIRVPLLILPALFEWIRLTPIPFLVLFDRNYQAGKEDALKTSRRFFSHHPARVFLLLIPTLLILAAELVMTISPSDSVSIWQAPIQHMGSILGFAGLRIVCDTFVLWRYRAAIDV